MSPIQTHMCTSVGPAIRIWAAYQWPHSQRKVSPHPPPVSQQWSKLTANSFPVRGWSSGTTPMFMCPVNYAEAMVMLHTKLSHAQHHITGEWGSGSQCTARASSWLQPPFHDGTFICPSRLQMQTQATTSQADATGPHPGGLCLSELTVLLLFTCLCLGQWVAPKVSGKYVIDNLIDKSTISILTIIFILFCS